MNNSTMNFTSEASLDSVYGLYFTTLDLCIYSISIIVGLPTHSYALWLIVTGPSGVASEFFILNLCVCEIGICLNSPLTVIFHYILRLSHQIALFLSGFLNTGRPLFQCLICVECYLAVVHPVTFLKYKPLRHRVVCCFVAWTFTLGSCFCSIFSVNQLAYYIYFSSTLYVLFLSVQLFCLVAVLRALKQSGPGERRREKEENHMKRRAFFIILITSLSMSIIYIPYIISGLYFIFTGHFIGYLFSFCFLCFILAGFVQPILYLHRSGKLRPLFSLKHSCLTLQ